MDNTFSAIIKDTYTLFQLKRRVKLLQSFFQQKFFQGVSFQPENASDDNWLKTLPPIFFESFNKDNVSELLTSLNTKITSLQPLTIYLAFEVSDEGLQEIGKKSRSLFGPSILLDIKYNPTL